VKIWVVSDLHLEIAGLEEPLQAPDGADVCVIAGDLTNVSPARGIEWIAGNIGIPAVYVAGNHEFYFGSVLQGYREAQRASDSHDDIHFLSNGMVVIQGVRFVGTTLWTDFSLMGNKQDAMAFAAMGMNDYRVVGWEGDKGERFRPEHSLRMHETSRAYLRDVLDCKHDGPTVVVTHHCPHPMSVHPKYRGQLLNAAFASDLSALIDEYQPELWIHGHTHESFDYRVGKTRVVCNPRGYHRENPMFDPRLAIEVC